MIIKKLIKDINLAMRQVSKLEIVLYIGYS